MLLSSIVSLIDMTKKSRPTYPSIVNTYRLRYDKMATSESGRRLAHYAESVLHDPIEGLDWKQLLDWEHRHFKYTRDELPKPRAEMPIDIIMQAKGRCGEFSLLYNGLLLANGYRTRMVIDCSTLQDKSKKVAGDHVWVEVNVDRVWIHVDPTEKKIDQPLMYVLEWDKDVNLVYAISREATEDVTSAYATHT